MPDPTKVTKCPRCGQPVWAPTLEASGCPVCKRLDSR
jgi:hypothetical protein